VENIDQKCTFTHKLMTSIIFSGSAVTEWKALILGYQKQWSIPWNIDQMKVSQETGSKTSIQTCCFLPWNVPSEGSIISFRM